MKKRLASLMLAMALMLAGNAGVTASAVEIRDLKMDCPSTIVVPKAGVSLVDLPFSGLGIDSITVAAGKNVTPKIVDANWQAFPKTCTARVQISVSGNGDFYFIMRNNNVKNEIFRKKFEVKIQSSSSSGKTTYIVTHAKGVNVRTAPVNGKIRKTLSKGRKFTVTTINKNWGYSPDYSAWICLDYCQKANTSSSSTSSASKGNTSKILSFAQKNAYIHAEWLCAEFVSRTLIEGELNIGVIKGCGTLYRTLEKSSQCTKYTLTINKNGRIYPTGNNKGKIAPGDALVIYCSKCKMYQHALLVGDVTNNGIHVYAHNNPHCNDIYSSFQYCSDCGGGHNTVYVFHLK